MTDRELMQQALDAMEDLHRTGDTQVFDLCFAPELLPALRARLAQPEPQPKRDGACRHCDGTGCVACDARHLPEQEPVAWNLRYNRYPREGDLLADIHLLRWQEALPQSLNTPPRREWVGLTEEEVDECYYWKGRQWTTDELVRHVEAKLKEKNA